MRQKTLADEGFEKFRKPTRREQFLDEMDQIIPWRDLCKVIKAFYPKPKSAGRPTVSLERMLRIHFLQHWFNLSDPAVEEALYDSRAMRCFVGIDLGREPVPDETTVCQFRHLLEAHNLGDQLFALIGEYLQENGMKVNTGTINELYKQNRLRRLNLRDLGPAWPYREAEDVTSIQEGLRKLGVPEW